MQSRSSSRERDPGQVSPVLFSPSRVLSLLKGPNAHLDVPSPTGPRTQSCHRVHGVAEKRPRRKKTERVRNVDGYARVYISRDAYICARVYVYENRDARHWRSRIIYDA